MRAASSRGARGRARGEGAEQRVALGVEEEGRGGELPPQRERRAERRRRVDRDRVAPCRQRERVGEAALARRARRPTRRPPRSGREDCERLGVRQPLALAVRSLRTGSASVPSSTTSGGTLSGTSPSASAALISSTVHARRRARRSRPRAPTAPRTPPPLTAARWWRPLPPPPPPRCGSAARLRQCAARRTRRRRRRQRRLQRRRRRRRRRPPPRRRRPPPRPPRRPPQWRPRPSPPPPPRARARRQGRVRQRGRARDVADGAVVPKALAPNRLIGHEDRAARNRRNVPPLQQRSSPWHRGGAADWPRGAGGVEQIWTAEDSALTRRTKSGPPSGGIGSRGSDGGGDVRAVANDLRGRADTSTLRHTSRCTSQPRPDDSANSRRWNGSSVRSDSRRRCASASSASQERWRVS